MKKTFAYIILTCVLPCGIFAESVLDTNLYDKNGFRVDQNITISPGIDKKSSPKSSIKNTVPVGQNKTEAFKKGEPASCFDYYTFGSIAVNLTQDQSTYKPGDPVILRGEIVNNNRYPLTGLVIRARLVRNTPNPEYLRSEIISVQDFNIVENISLNAGEIFDVDHSYLLPINAPKGEYQLFFYAYDHDRFNQAGLSFTNDIVASGLSFIVAGNNPQHVYLDQTRIQLNEQAHNVMAFMTQHKKETPIHISIPLVNPSSQNEDMLITYTLYKWDGLREENKVDTITEKITVPANKEIQLTYTTNKTDTSVYYLNITADTQTPKKDSSVYDISTASNIRFVVNGYDFPRINSFGVDTYPIKKGEEATLFTCYHNGATQETSNDVKIKTTLLDIKGKVISETEYQGKINGRIEAIVNKFTTKKDLINFTVVTTVTDSADNVIDRIESEYKCEDLNPTLCPQPTNYKWFLGALGLLLLVGLIAWIIRAKHTSPTAMFMGVFILVATLTNTIHVEAATVKSNFDINTILSNSWHVWGSFEKEFNFSKDGINQGSSFVLNNGDSVIATNKPTSGSWFLAGDLNDSPPMDGVLYLHQGGYYTYNSQTGEIEQDVTFSQGGEASGAASVSVPIESGSIEIVSSNPNVVSCMSGECVAKSAGTSEITVFFKNTEQNSPYNYSCLKRISANGPLITELLWDFCDIVGDAPYISDSTGYFQTLGYSPSNSYHLFPSSEKQNLSGFYKSGNSGFGLVNVFLYSEFGEYDAEYAVYFSHAYSFPSITYTVTVPGVANQPQVSSCGGITDISETGATIRWNYSDIDNDPQDNYQIQIATDGGFANIVQSIMPSANTDVATIRSAAITGLSPNTTYYARVRSHNNTNNWSAYESCANFKTLTPPITATCTPSTTTTLLHQPIIWTASAVAGGTGIFVYSWSGTDGLTGTTQSLSKTYTITGSKTASVTITSGNQTKTLSCPSVVISSELTDMCKNIEDIQTTVPSGLSRTAQGDCVCGT